MLKKICFVYHTEEFIGKILCKIQSKNTIYKNVKKETYKTNL